MGCGGHKSRSPGHLLPCVPHPHPELGWILGESLSSQPEASGFQHPQHSADRKAGEVLPPGRWHLGADSPGVISWLCYPCGAYWLCCVVFGILFLALTTATCPAIFHLEVLRSVLGRSVLRPNLLLPKSGKFFPLSVKSEFRGVGSCSSVVQVVYQACARP